MEIGTMYDNVKTLLLEICMFFEKEFLGGQMSGDDLKKRAHVLLNSSKKQIIQLAQFAADEGYLDMRGKKRLMQISSPLESYVECDNKSSLPEDIYSSPDDQEDENLEKEPEKVPEAPLNADSTLLCPYRHMLLADIKPDKEGLLARREQFIGFFTVSRSYHIAIYNKWMLFFNQHRRGKMLESYCLKTCIIKDIDEDSLIFDILFPSHTFSMVAANKKEKRQWLSIIKDIVAEREIVLESGNVSPVKTPDTLIKVSESLLKHERTPEVPRRSANKQHIELPPPPAYENYDKSTQSHDDQIYDLFENNPRAKNYDDNIYEDPEELYKNHEFITDSIVAPPQLKQRISSRSNDFCKVQSTMNSNESIEEQPIYDQLGDVLEQVSILENKTNRAKSSDVPPPLKQRLKSRELPAKINTSCKTQSIANQQLEEENIYDSFGDVLEQVAIIKHTSSETSPPNTSKNGSNTQVEEAPIYDCLDNSNNDSKFHNATPENIYNDLADIAPEVKSESMAHKFMNKVTRSNSKSSSYSEEKHKKVRRTLFRNKK